MKGHGAKFTHKMEEAVAALLTHRNQEEAARSVGIGVATLLRWQKLPEFQTAYRLARRQAVAQAMARLQQSPGAAVSTMQRLMVESGTPAAVKARISQTILEFAIRGVELEDIEVRVSELERAAEEAKNNR